MKTAKITNMRLLVEPGAEVDSLACEVIGAAVEVHRQFGPGYLESLYEEVMIVELGLRSTRYERQGRIQAGYKNHLVGEGGLDLFVLKILPIELRAVEALAPVHQARLLSCQKMAGLQSGLLINFNVPLRNQGMKRAIL